MTSISQPILTATADRKEAVLGETVSVRFLLRGSNEVDGFVPPPFSGFTIVHGPDTRLEFVASRGLKVPTATISYLLRPDRTGVLEIGSATAGSSGWRVYSPPLQIRVIRSPTQKESFGGPSDSDPAAEAMVRKGLFIRLETSRSEAYVGEPFLVTYKLYTRLNSESQVLQRPSFAGFSVVEVQSSDSSAPVDEVVEGQNFQTYVLRRVYLIPLREGEYELGPVVVYNKVSLEDPASPTGESSLSRLLSRLQSEGGYQGASRKTEITLQSPSRRIRVRPLPSGAPLDFTGAVGRFALSLKSERDTLAAGDVSRLKLVLEGSGNLPLAGHPQMEWPEGMESFETEIIDETDPTRTPLSGKRTLVLPFTSKTPGLFSVKPHSMSAFDPSTGRFYPLQSDSVTVFFTPSVPSTVEKSDPSSGRSGRGMSSSLLFLLAAVLTAFACFAAWRHMWGKRHAERRKADTQVIAGSSSAPLSFDAAPHLQAAGRLLSDGSPAECCRTLHRVLLRLAETRYGVTYVSGREVFAEGLVRNGVAHKKAEDWADLLVECEVEAFRPIADAEAVGRLLERAGRLLA